MPHNLIQRYATRHEVESDHLPWPTARPRDLPEDHIGHDRLGAALWWAYILAVVAVIVTVWWWKG